MENQNKVKREQKYTKSQLIRAGIIGFATGIIFEGFVTFIILF